MRLLLDTHILLWYIEGNEILPLAWREHIQSPENQNVVSIVSLWEIAIKTNIGKLTIKYPLDQFIPAGFEILPISLPHLQAYQQLPLHHRDRNVGPALRPASDCPGPNRRADTDDARPQFPTLQRRDIGLIIE